MTYLVKAIKWAYGDSLKYIAFLTALTAFIGVLMTFIAYPWQTVITAVLGLGTVALFLLFSEWR